VEAEVADQHQLQTQAAVELDCLVKAPLAQGAPAPPQQPAVEAVREGKTDIKFLTILQALPLQKPEGVAHTAAVPGALVVLVLRHIQQVPLAQSGLFGPARLAHSRPLTLEHRKAYATTKTICLLVGPTKVWFNLVDINPCAKPFDLFRGQFCFGPIHVGCSQCQQLKCFRNAESKPSHRNNSL
jgi:hypothetical protein